MIFTVDIRSNLEKIARDLTVMEKKQLPFAINLTLNKLAVKAQDNICKNLQKVFNNANSWYDRHQRTSTKVSFAAKDNPVASVYTKAHFAHIQEEWGIRQGYRGGNMAIPIDQVPKRQRSSKTLRARLSYRHIFKLGNSIYRRLSSRQL